MCELPDKSILWIEGEFERIHKPTLLVYTWSIDPEATATERVTVTFAAAGAGTEVGVKHERIETAALSDQHLQGWIGCLDGLDAYLAAHR